MRTAAFFFIVNLLALPQIACAESTGEALDAFGLTGAWSTACEKLPADGGLRVTYEKTLFGARYITVVSGLSGNLITTKSRIKSASRITEEKLKYIYEIESTTAEHPLYKIGEPWERVFLKIGKKLQEFEYRSLDGRMTLISGGYRYKAMNSITNWIKTDEKPPLLEQCLN
jgi:hypothetical protein